MPGDINWLALDGIDAEIARLLTPMPAPLIVAEIEALRNHYGEWADRSRGQAKRLHRDWIEDLADTPGAYVREACRRWRRAGDPPHKRPPFTAGELLESVLVDIERLRWMTNQVERARAVLASRRSA